MLLEALQRLDAYGRENAVKGQKLAEHLHTDIRSVKRMVAKERAEGNLICSSWAGGGYFLPTCLDEIMAQKRSLEKGFISRANAVRVFRKAAKQDAWK